MATNHIEIGPTPFDEPCVQVGGVGHGTLDRFECDLFKEQLERQFPGGRFGVRRCPHELGAYCEVWAFFDDEDEVEMNIAYKAESEAWETWAPDIKARLIKHGMMLGYMLTKHGWERMLP